jgi:hypothetical protein
MRGLALPVVGAALAVVGQGLPAAAAPANKPAAPKASVAAYCAAAKAWLAYEQRTLADGPIDVQWVKDTDRLMRRMVDTAPKAIRRDTVTLAWFLISSRQDLVNVGPNEDAMEGLLLDAKILAERTSDTVKARDAVGAYAKKNCGIDVLAPFRAIAGS